MYNSQHMDVNKALLTHFTCDDAVHGELVTGHCRQPVNNAAILQHGSAGNYNTVNSRQLGKQN